MVTAHHERNTQNSEEKRFCQPQRLECIIMVLPDSHDEKAQDNSHCYCTDDLVLPLRRYDLL